MLFGASLSYGDNSFVNRTASANNRILPLKNTDMYIMTALSPASRVRTVEKIPLENEEETEEGQPQLGNRLDGPFDRRQRQLQLFGPPDDAIVYLGGSQSDKLYSTAQGSAYVVGSNLRDGFYYMSEGKTHEEYRLYKGTTPHDFSFRNFNDFSPDEDEGRVEIENDPGRFGNGGDLMTNINMRAPFRGAAPKVAAIAAISSAVVGTLSPASSVTFAQALSKARAGLREALGPVTVIPGLVLFDVAVNRLYQRPILDNIAVCSQWPQPCGERDGYFLDGGAVENLALSPIVSQYQRQESTIVSKKNIDNNKPLKIILTSTNSEWIDAYGLTQILQYFDSPVTDGIEPGGYLSLPSRTVPIRSPQVFEDYMDEAMLNALLEPIPGSNMTTALMPSLTTTDNPVYGIEAGQAVQLLLINLNEDLSAFVAGPSIIRNVTAPHAEMVRKIAANDILVQRVRDFYLAP